MANEHLGLSASKSEMQPTPADRRLNEQRRRAGLVHNAIVSAVGSVAAAKNGAVEQAFSVQLPNHAPKQARKSEQVALDPTIAKLRLSPDGGLLLAAMKSEMTRNNGRPVDMVAERAGEVLGIGRIRAVCAKDELLQRGLIRPVVNSLGGRDGYRVMPFGV
ncbi:hypothetical protein [Sphingobium sp. YR657]|uniref:hypothetical protein n=1 Tax=Sphingobium sp. YR657 TaxID=1884366 RepID=UPI0031378906